MDLQLSLRRIGGASDIKLLGFDGVSFDLAEDKHLKRMPGNILL